MKIFGGIAFACLGVLSGWSQEQVALFNGVDLSGFKATETEMWKVIDGCIVGGNGVDKIKKNTYLFTENIYGDFELSCQFKLVGDAKMGLINSGIQFRSEKLENGHPKGYQADIGDPKWWGCIYDEHRRGLIGVADQTFVQQHVKKGDWNTYVIRCKGSSLQLFINGFMTMDYTEKDDSIPRNGYFAFQLHSGGNAQVFFRDISIRDLRSSD